MLRAACTVMVCGYGSLGVALRNDLHTCLGSEEFVLMINWGWLTLATGESEGGLKQNESCYLLIINSTEAETEERRPEGALSFVIGLFLCFCWTLILFNSKVLRLRFKDLHIWL